MVGIKFLHVHIGNSETKRLSIFAFVFELRSILGLVNRSHTNMSSQIKHLPNSSLGKVMGSRAELLSSNPAWSFFFFSAYLLKFSWLGVEHNNYCGLAIPKCNMYYSNCTQQVYYYATRYDMHKSSGYFFYLVSR